MLSIITPSFNSGRFIEETIRSVVYQTKADFEYIVVDGGSTDTTIDILKKYSGKIHWISEPDHGQADAINKGFGIARGDIFAWLNADDYYLPDVFQYISSSFEANPNLVMLYGEGQLVDENGRFIEMYPSEDFHLPNLAYRCFLCQPTVFFRRFLFEKAGGLDTAHHIALDLDLWIRIGKLIEKNPGWQIEFIRKPLACQRMHKKAKTLDQRTRGYEEIIDVVKRHFGFVPFNWIYGREETADGRYDGYFSRSPFSLRLIFRSLIHWMAANKRSPVHIASFFLHLLFSPVRGVRLLLNHTSKGA